MYITEDSILQLEEHAEQQLPREAVALLFGITSGTDVYVKHIELMENESPQNQTSFSVNPEDQYALLMEADTRGESMVGIFHSHPAPPRPSQSDISNMKLNPVIWIIASKTTGEWVMRAYYLEAEAPITISMEYVT